ncbi:transposase [Actinoplanes sp. L3-i22]|uniref:pPIWI_RE_Z domain-containing protein n=1 Tax=Actinoplanes sp. L3-i22 TaxID=2836373 RepID=UPI001C790471|nr:transposase [Actinoplanes sp. L3-i22]BCY13183.1 hypothetical protein L3i22_082710 [Actinoplanes sp. L3-i22]
MRQIRNVHARFRRALDRAYEPADNQPPASRLMDIELSLYLLETVATGQSAAGVPALLDGYRAVWDSVIEVPADAFTRLANARTVLWPNQRSYGWDSALRDYLSTPPDVRGYRLDELGRPVRLECRLAPDRWAWYEQILTTPLPFAPTMARTAEPGPHRMRSTARGVGVNIPADLPPAPEPELHDLSVRQREPLEVTWADLEATAARMDATDRHLGFGDSRWAERLRDVTLQVRQADDTFQDGTILRIDRMLHLVGMVSVGKSTLVLVLAVWAAQHGRRVTIVVGDNSSALRASNDLSRYDDVLAAPVMGQNRKRHAERLHRLQPPAPGRLLPRAPYGFDLVSTACALDGIRETATPLGVREAPCQDLIATDGEEPADGWRSGTRRVCPLWHRCQRHEAARRLVDANVWIATPWSLVHTRVPDPLSADQMRYLEAAWRRSDLILVDEADQVQTNLDAMFASSQVLLGPSDEAWIDEIDARVREKLRVAGRAQVRSRQIRRFTLALNNARTAADIIYQLLHRDRVRAGRPVLSWVDPNYFTAWSLFDNLARDWAGLGSQRDPGWDDDKLYQLLRTEFNEFIDAPTDASTGEIAPGIARLAEVLLSNTEEETREANVRRWLTELTGRELTGGMKVAPSDIDRNVWRLELAVAVAVLVNRLNLMLTMWPEVAAELELFDTLPAEVRRAPVDLAVAVPESPMGNVLGFQYVEDEPTRRDGELGEFRFFRYTGVGRALLVRMPELFPADGHGPNVLLLSGTSWAGTSPRYHIDVPVNGILRPTAEKLAEINRTTFALDLQHTGEHSTPIWVSGRFGEARASALRQMVEALTRPGPGLQRLNRLERERAALPDNRKKIMLLVGSYAEARTVTEEIRRLKSSWSDQVRCLVGDDEQESGWDDAHLLRRFAVSDFGTDDAWLLVAPILAVERGHNILNEEGVAAIGAAFFLVRPHPRPKDLGYVTQRINQYALEQMRPQRIDLECAEHDRLAEAGRQRRRTAHRQWRRLLHAMVAYSRLHDDERNRVAWTQLVTIWQVVGRLLRGGQAAKIYFCDAAFAPNTARRSDNIADIDDASTSLLLGMRAVLDPYFAPAGDDADRHLVQALYQPLHRALTKMGDH